MNTVTAGRGVMADECSKSVRSGQIPAKFLKAMIGKQQSVKVLAVAEFFDGLPQRGTTRVGPGYPDAPDR